MLFDGIYIAVLVIEHVDDAGIGCGPSDVFRVERPIGRRHIGYLSVWTLRILNIAEPFLIKQSRPEHVTLPETSHGTVSEPAHSFVALRAVGGHTSIVAADAPVGVMIDLVQRRIGAGE